MSKGINQEQARIHRVNELWEWVKKKPNYEKKELVGKFCYQYGTSRRTTLEYIKILIDAKKIKEKDGKLY